MDYEITKISYDPIHIHDASNYAREALGENQGFGVGGYAAGRVVTTLVGDGTFQITVRIKGSLDGYTAKLPLLNGSDRVWHKDLKAAVEALKEKIRVGDSVTDEIKALRSKAQQAASMQEIANKIKSGSND